MKRVTVKASTVLKCKWLQYARLSGSRQTYAAASNEYIPVCSPTLSLVADAHHVQNMTKFWIIYEGVWRTDTISVHGENHETWECDDLDEALVSFEFLKERYARFDETT